MEINKETLNHCGFSFYMHLIKKYDVMMMFDMNTVRKKSTAIVIN